MFSRTALLSFKEYPLVIVCFAFILTACGGGSSDGTPSTVQMGGAIATLAGSTQGYLDDPSGTTAQFYNPYGITTDGTNLYVADTFNNRIRQIVIATGAVTTVAGDGTASYLDDPSGTTAQFNSPGGITNDGTNLYVADTVNNRIRQIVIATGAVTTVAGNGNTSWYDGTGTAATFDGPEGITTDGTNLYVADNGNERIRQVVIATGAVTTVAGSTQGYLDGTGTTAKFKSPVGISTDGTNLYVADTVNNRIRKIQ